MENQGEINHIWASFFRGQLVLALVVGTKFSIIGLVLGLPFPLAMGLLAGLLEFLPSVGHGIWLTIAALLAGVLGILLAASAKPTLVAISFPARSWLINW